VFARPIGRVYSLKAEHVELLGELDRLFPERAPVVDFGSIPLGSESVEVVAQRLHAALLSRFEQPLFVAFCHVNAERLLDAIAHMIDRGAYPLSREATLADTYVRYYEHLRAPDRIPSSIDSIFEFLCSLAAVLVKEQVDFVASCELPLPGLKLPPLDPGDMTMRRVESDLGAIGCSITPEVARHWVSHALLRMHPDLRRVLHLRERERLSLTEVGRHLSIDPFEAGLRVKRAWLDLRERLARTMVAFRAGTPAPDKPQPAGRLLSMPRRDGTGGRPVELDVADAACRIANAILATDHVFAAATFTRDDPLIDHTNPLDALEVLVPLLFGKLESSPSPLRTSAAVSHYASQFRDALRRLDQDLRRSTLGERIACARRIVDLAADVSSGKSSSVHVVRSHLEWYWGNSEDVPAHLERALSTARTPRERAKVLCNMSVWHSGVGSIDLALRLSRSGIDVEPNFPTAHLNRFRWLSTVADADATDCLTQLIATKPGRVLVSTVSRSRHEKVMRSIAMHLGVDRRVSERRTTKALTQLDALRARVDQEALV
jgi:DNA-directed RNA polymerase specialized sigma24 family protein